MRSLPHAGQRLTIEPARCLGCDFEFEERTRFKKARAMSDMQVDADCAASLRRRAHIAQLRAAKETRRA